MRSKGQACFVTSRGKIEFQLGTSLEPDECGQAGYGQVPRGVNFIVSRETKGCTKGYGCMVSIPPNETGRPRVHTRSIKAPAFRRGYKTHEGV